MGPNQTEMGNLDTLKICGQHLYMCMGWVANPCPKWGQGEVMSYAMHTVNSILVTTQASLQEEK